MPGVGLPAPRGSVPHPGAAAHRADRRQVCSVLARPTRPPSDFPRRAHAVSPCPPRHHGPGAERDTGGDMGKYIVRRILQMIPVILGATFIIFAMVFALPGDPTAG